MNNKNVLLVDDSMVFRGSIARALRNAGYCVATAADGEEALRFARERLPNLIVLDVMLPRIGGLQVLHTLKKDPATSQIPIIILSSLSQQNAEKLRNDGAAAFIEKNQTDTSALIRAVNRIMELTCHDTPVGSGYPSS